MTFMKRKDVVIWSREKLEKLARPDLNTVALKWGLVPHDALMDEDLVDEIITQQAAKLQEMEADDRERIANPEAMAMAQEQNPVKEQPKTGTSEPAVKTGDAGNERIWMRIASGATALEKADVFAAVNGDSILIKRGSWVKIRKKFLPVFRDAITTVVEVDGDEKTIRHVPRFNISVRTLAQGLPGDDPNRLSAF